MISNVFRYSYAFHLSNNNKWYYQDGVGEYYDFFVIVIHYIWVSVHVGFLITSDLYSCFWFLEKLVSVAIFTFSKPSL